MLKLNYKIEDGMQISHAGTGKLTVNTLGDGTFNTINLETGATSLLSYNEMVSALNRPGTSTANGHRYNSKGSSYIRDGGLHYREQLSLVIREQFDFRGALMRAIQVLKKDGFRIYATGLNDPKIRKHMRDIAAEEYTKNPISFTMRGGSISRVATIPKGRWLMDKYTLWCDAGFDDMVLPDRAHLRGNRSNHGVSQRVYELITVALDKVYLDTRKRTPAAVLQKHKDLIAEENDLRELNGLRALSAVSHKTITRHIKNMSKTALDIARNGERWAANNRSSGSTDSRSLMIGQEIEIDECKLSLMVVAKRHGFWQKLTLEQKGACEEIDEVLTTRLWLVLMLDVATRMPLGWALTNTPSHEVTLEVMRMATRDKTREARQYGCDCEPMSAIGVASMKGDNGTGLRNSFVKSSALGIQTQTVDARAYHGVDKPYVERMFGTIESVLLQMLDGYTGRRAGILPGYDPIKSGVIDVNEIYGIITRYLIDEYPYERHYGTTMMGARPANMAKEISEEYGVILPPADHDRRIHFGWKSEVLITDEGVKAFNLPFNSSAIQELRDIVNGKVSVFVDPDNIANATVLVVGHPEPILVEMTWTAMKDLTLKQFLDVALQARKETPEETRLVESHLARVRRNRETKQDEWAIERNVPRSFMTREEADAKAVAIRTGLSESRPTERMAGTTRAGGIMDAVQEALPVNNVAHSAPFAHEPDAIEAENFTPPTNQEKLS